MVLQARDERGNKRLSGGDEFQVLLRAAGGAAALAAAVADKGDGIYSVTYTATLAGVYQLEVTIGESVKPLLGFVMHGCCWAGR